MCQIHVALPMTCRQLYSAKTRQTASSRYCFQANFIKRWTRSRSHVSLARCLVISSIPRGRLERGLPLSSGACEKLHQDYSYRLMLVHVYSPLPWTREYLVQRRRTPSEGLSMNLVPRIAATSIAPTEAPLHHSYPTSSCTPHFATLAPCTTTIVVVPSGHSQIPQLPRDTCEGQQQLACIKLPARLHARTATAARLSH